MTVRQRADSATEFVPGILPGIVVYDVVGDGSVVRVTSYFVRQAAMYYL